MKTVTTIRDLRAEVRAWRQAGDTVGLVPTMGALHEGHLALVRHARAKTLRTCATLFVNPTQFGPGEDFAAYPRSDAEDAAKLTAEKVDLLFKPATAEIYPADHVTRVRVDGLGDVLEGEFRPGFFVGVATVVTKLLLQSLPDVAVFGEKDFQQLLVIRRLVRDLDIPVRIEQVATVRDADGLALSSRNAYLTSAERKIAPALYGTISQVAENVARGAGLEAQATWGAGQLERAGFTKVDYLAVGDAATLDPVADAARPARVLAAAWLGRTRLIDNVPV